jgi:hypothetical protein
MMNRIISLGTNLRKRIDNTGTNLRERIDTTGANLRERIDIQEVRLEEQQQQLHDNDDKLTKIFEYFDKRMNEIESDGDAKSSGGFEKRMGKIESGGDGDNSVVVLQLF